jgi:hypothetical protein
MKKWPFEPLVFNEKTPQEMCDAAQEFVAGYPADDAKVPVIGKLPLEEIATFED